jgi:hypothetical protein
MTGGQPMGNHFEKTAGGVFMPAVIRDDINIVSHADGKTYDSKSAYYKSLKTLGFEIIGNEKQPEKKHEIDDKRLEASILYAMAQSGLIDVSQLSYEQLDMIEKEFYPEQTETEDLLCHQK